MSKIKQHYVTVQEKKLKEINAMEKLPWDCYFYKYPICTVNLH